LAERLVALSQLLSCGSLIAKLLGGSLKSGAYSDSSSIGDKLRASSAFFSLGARAFPISFLMRLLSTSKRHIYLSRAQA
jgi:hypothetical protein